MIRLVPARWIGLGALLTVVGLAVAATAPVAGTEGSARTQTQENAGGLAVLVGWAVLGWGIHSFGRGRQG